MDARHEATVYTNRRRRKKRWRSAVTALAAVVVFCTTYALILPAITMAQETYCGMEEHRHGDECYETVLVCDKEFDVVQPEGHIHTATCYDYEEVLTCGLEECEDTVHEHTDDCYDEEGNLVCTEPEVIEGHTHTEDCYSYEETLICGEEEQEEILEPHRHTEACYTREFVCTKPEHTHSLICYSDKSADLESAGVWEATIPELTGETAGENVALVAKSQIGYTQSGRNYEVDDAGGKHGYTRYGAWYGYPYSEWCAMFASFCLHYAGVEQTDVPYAAGCVYWIEHLTDAGLYERAGDYTPKTGDLVFFDTDGDGVSDHVGIVTGLHGETMETVEGNIGGEVVEERHELTDEDVFGFGVLPQEENLPDAPVIDDPEHPTPAEENPEENPDENPEEEAPDENPDEEEPEEDPDENPEEQAPEPVCGLEEHEHTDACYSADGELICGLEEHRHTDACYAEASDEPQESPYTEEELEAFLTGFTQEVEQFEALEELTDEDVLAAQELLTRLEQAHQDGQLSDEDYVALYARVQALFWDGEEPLGEQAIGDDYLLLNSRGVDTGPEEWYADDVSDVDAAQTSAWYAAAASDTGESQKSDVQIDYHGGKETDADAGVTISKYIAGTELENVFDITLNVTTPQKAQIVQEEADVAVVIVMDVSETMNSSFDGDTRYWKARAAAEDFMWKFMQQGSSQSRLGFVAFNTDAHEVFKPSSCSNQNELNALYEKERSITQGIISQSDYRRSHSRFTNIEAGLRLGYDMLNNTSNKHKYIIFLSDGFPTTYFNGQGDYWDSRPYGGYDPYCSSGNPGQDGVFYDMVSRKYCVNGTSYSDKAAIRAQNQATEIKNHGITIFSIGVDIGGQTIQTYLDAEIGQISVVDRTSTTYAIGGANDPNGYKNWLKDKIGSGYYYDSNNATQLSNAFNQIFEAVKKTIATGTEADWVAEDPIPSSLPGMVEFINFWNQGGTQQESLSGASGESAENTAKLNTDADNPTINWDLKNSGYTTTVVDNTTYYRYQLRYRVRLKNEASEFLEKDERGTPKYYDTNGNTTLTYRVLQKVNGKLTLSDQRTLTFPVPDVMGYLSELTFLKQDQNGTALAGAQFQLTHDERTCGYCRGDGVSSTEVPDQTETSDADGKVTFTRIPSGHTYTLTETKAPEGYSKTFDKYRVTVAYGELTVQKLDESNEPVEGTIWNLDDQDVIVNKGFYELPSTGGSGTTWFTVGGLALGLTAGLGLYQIKRRRRREDTASF